MTQSTPCASCGKGAHFRCCELHDAIVCWACFWLSATPEPTGHGLEARCRLDLPLAPFDVEKAAEKLRAWIAELAA